jgi:hypothetical protein
MSQRHGYVRMMRWSSRYAYTDTGHTDGEVNLLIRWIATS